MQKLVGGVTTVLEAPNLVANPGGETEGVPGEPASWFRTLSGTTWATPGRTDTRGFRLHPTAELSDWRCAVFPLTEGLARVRVYVKGSGDAKTIIAFRWFSDAEGANWIGEEWMLLPSAYAEWTLREGIFTVPAGAQSGDLMFRVFEATTVDLSADDFYVGRV